MGQAVPEHPVGSLRGSWGDWLSQGKGLADVIAPRSAAQPEGS